MSATYHLMQKTRVDNDNRTGLIEGEHCTDPAERLDVLAAAVAGRGVAQAEAWARILMAAAAGPVAAAVASSLLRDWRGGVPGPLAPYLDWRAASPARGAHLRLTAAGLWWLAGEIWKHRPASKARAAC